MARANNISGTDNSNPQLVIILLRHASNTIVDLAKSSLVFREIGLTTGRDRRSRFA